MKFLRSKRIFSIVALLSTWVLLGAGCGGSQAPDQVEDVTLKYWRVFDGDDAFDEIINAYQAQHPYVNIDYRVLRFDEYEEELIRALAEGTGPDIFALHNTDLRSYQDLLMPMPTSVDVKFLETVGSVRKETVLSARSIATPSQRAIKEQFADVVSQDVLLPYQENEDAPVEDKIFGLPLSVDTLALYYNKDLFNAAGIAAPPKTWEEFLGAVKALTTYHADGTLQQSGAALGTVDNVDRAADVLQALMLQNGTTMVDSRGRVAFHTIPTDVPDGVYPGLDAVRFFADFANPLKESYTWNAEMPGSVEAFASGQTAMMLGYSYHLPIIRSASPKLPIGVAPLPQIGSDSKQVNFANYWVEVVSKDTKYPDEAWDFVLFATGADHVMSYLDEAQKPTALRSLIDEQIEHETLGPFVEQILTADSWYTGFDESAMEEAFLDVAREVLEGNRDAEDALGDAARVVAQTYDESW